MSLRDEKKDLDVLQKLDLKYGDILPALKLYQRIFERIKTTKEICGFGDGIVRSPEWKGCGMKGNKGFKRSKREGMKILTNSYSGPKR